MQIRRVTTQGPESLEEFYRRAADQPDHQRAVSLMLSLLSELRTEMAAHDVWAATTGTDLMLLSRDDPRSPALATIHAKTKWYFIEAPLPASLRPWADAWVKGHTDDVTQACHMLRRAISWAQLF